MHVTSVFSTVFVSVEMTMEDGIRMACGWVLGILQTGIDLEFSKISYLNLPFLIKVWNWISKNELVIDLFAYLEVLSFSTRSKYVQID